MTAWDCCRPLDTAIPTDQESKRGRVAWLADRTIGHQGPESDVVPLVRKSALRDLTGLPENPGWHIGG
jgi:hypothetical protein